MPAPNFFLVLWAAIALASCPPSHARAQALAEDARAENEHVEAAAAVTGSADDRMTVPVTIAGAGPYPFIVDTAAERSVIARELADELGLERLGRARILSMTSSRDMTIVRAPSVSFLPGRSRDLQAFAIRGENVGASGVLGIDALRGQRVVLDFEAQELRVGPAPSRRTERVGADDIVVRGRLRYGQLILADAHAGGTPVDVIIDSGLQVSVGNDALRRLLTARRATIEPIALLSITGETLTADYTRVDRLVIGGVAVNGLPVAFADAHFFSRLRLTRRPALLLGMDVLRMFAQVTVDFPNRQAQFTLRDAPAQVSSE